MVTHLGSVGFFWTNSGSKLKRWVRTHSDAKVRENPAYRKLLTKSYAKLRKRMLAAWAQVNESLNEIRAYALEKGLKIGSDNGESSSSWRWTMVLMRCWSRSRRRTCAGIGTTWGMWGLSAAWACSSTARLEANAARLLGFPLHDRDEEGNDY